MSEKVILSEGHWWRCDEQKCRQPRKCIFYGRCLIGVRVCAHEDCLNCTCRPEEWCEGTEQF